MSALTVVSSPEKFAWEATRRLGRGRSAVQFRSRGMQGVGRAARWHGEACSRQTGSEAGAAVPRGTGRSARRARPRGRRGVRHARPRSSRRRAGDACPPRGSSGRRGERRRTGVPLRRPAARATLGYDASGPGATASPAQTSTLWVRPVSSAAGTSSWRMQALVLPSPIGTSGGIAARQASRASGQRDAR